MAIGRYLVLAGGLAAALATAMPVLAASAQDGNGFERFYGIAKAYCAKAPAKSCIDRLWRIADANRDGVLNLAEVQALDAQARFWAQSGDGSRPSRERNTTLVVLMVLKQAGLPQVFDRFDTDRDGTLTRAELFADFKFDKRPFPKLVADRSAVNWDRLGPRFGPIGTLLASLVKPAPEPHEAPPPRR